MERNAPGARQPVPEGPRIRDDRSVVARGRPVELDLVADHRLGRGGREGCLRGAAPPGAGPRRRNGGGGPPAPTRPPPPDAPPPAPRSPWFSNRTLHNPDAS